MNTKKILVSLCTIAIALFMVATVSAVCDVTSTSCACPGTPQVSTTTPALANCVIIEVEGIKHKKCCNCGFQRLLK